MTDPQWLNENEQCLWRTWRQMYLGLEAALDRQLSQDSGLSVADYAILVPLSESPNGRQRSRELRTTTNWDRSRMAHQLRRMEKRGLIVRQDCPEDARGTVACLTAAGHAAIEAAAPGHVDAVRRYFIDNLSEAEIDILRDVSQRMLAVLNDAEQSTTTDEGHVKLS